MYKFTNKVLLGVLGFAFSSSLAFALDAEFKNSLMKIELNKANDGAYIVNLYTKNKFSEPVKVIKKSDLNYYILLPETKNESTRTTSNGGEIRSISTNVYPYAGQDIKNGYVKINIDTTRPLEFKVNVKNFESTPKTAQNTTVAQNEIKKEVKKEITSSEKKNSTSSTSKKELKQDTSTSKTKVEPPKIEEVIQQEVEKAKEEIKNQEQEELSESSELEETYEENIIAQEDLAEIEQIVNGKKEDKKHNFSILKQKIATKLSQYGISFKEFTFMLIAFIFSFIFMLIILTRKTTHVRLKSKADLAEKEIKPNFNTAQKQEIKNDGQYFVFDKSVKQIGFCDPSTSAIRKNYELSSYEPELKNKYTRNINPANRKFESEYDIIQKILKEDTFIDLPATTQVVANKPKQQEPPKEIQQVSAPIEQKKVETKAPKKEEKKVEISEPTILSSVEIAPERGFMCVSYNDNISLMGYIFDDVFALYNFKAQKLENYDIKFRLSEKDDKLARFIVKVMDTKMLIKVTKSEMIMEVIL